MHFAVGNLWPDFPLYDIMYVYTDKNPIRSKERTDSMAGRSMAFIIWTIMGVMFVAMGICSFCARKPKPFGFWANVKVADIENVKDYNRALGILWCVDGLLFILLGLPFLAKDSPGLIIISVLGVVFISIAAMIVYETGIVPRYRKKK